MIQGVEITPLKKYSDHRGWLTETFRQDELPEGVFPAMMYVSQTFSGIARGPHEHVTQTDIFIFMGPGAFKVYLWDSRQDSETFGEKMTFEAGEDNPVRVVVDSKCRTPIDARITNGDAHTVIACANEYKEEFKSSEKFEAFKEKGVKVFFSGDKRVDLSALMSYLHEEGIEKLMLEGGATLNFSMIKAGLIDEIRICIAPMVVGGANAKTFFDGEGFDLMDDAVKLELIDSYSLGKDLILTYKVI